MGNELDKALENAKKIAFDIDTDKYVVMSDQHLGDGKGPSDDFSLNKEVYKKALDYYYNEGYKFINIGDSEELWECDFPDIRQMYPDVYPFEKKFSDTGRLFRLYGNHDIFWRRKSFVDEYLQPELPGIAIHESLLLEGKEGRIFLTHGHQGEFFSDALWPVSRFFVRNVWKPVQNLFGFGSDGAAKNVKKRSEREQEYYQWAKEKRLLLIAGHTHRAMFGSLSKVDRLRMEIEKLVREISALSGESPQYKEKMDEISRKKTELKTRMEKEFGQEPDARLEKTGFSSPCYFNDGCCCYDNGITAMEIDKHMIRLVKWDRARGERNIYEEDNLKELFIKIELF